MRLVIRRGSWVVRVPGERSLSLGTPGLHDASPLGLNDRNGRRLMAMSEASKTNSIVTVGNVLRHGVAGGVFVLSYCYSNDPKNPVEQLRQINQAYFVVLALALLFGILIYSLHRACANPLIELLRQEVWRRRNNWWKWFRSYAVPEEIFRLMWRRWLYLSGSKDIHSHVTDWGDYVHLQYCTAWAVALGSFAARLTSASDSEWRPDGLLIVIVLCCLSSRRFR